MYLPAAVQWRLPSAVYKGVCQPQSNAARCEVYITHCGIFPPSNLPETEKFAQVPLEACAHCSRYGRQPEIEKKLCLRRAETPAAEEASSGDSRNERSPQEKKPVAKEVSGASPAAKE